MMRWIQEIRALSKRISKARVDAYAAQSAFYLIMGFIPFIMLLLTLLQYTTVTKTDAMELLMQIFPVSFQGFLEDIVSEIYVKSTTVMSISVIAAVWACGRGVLAITNGLNSVNGLKETRNYLFRRIRSGFYVVILVLSIVLALVLFVFGNAVHDVLIDRLTFLRKISGMLIWLRTAGTVIALSLLMAAMYTFLPNAAEKIPKPASGGSGDSLELVPFFLCIFHLSGASFRCCEYLRKPDHRGHADAVALFLHVADLFRSHAQCGHRRKNWEEVLTKPIRRDRMFAVLQAMMVTSRRFISSREEESAAESFSRFFERSEFHTGAFLLKRQ